MHHLSIFYVANIPSYYLEPTNDPLVSGVLFNFQLLNQSFFMGLLFLISGYFTPPSFDHKGSVKFIKDRLVRLGIPLIIYIFVINPVALLVGIHYTSPSLNIYTIVYAMLQLFPWWQLYPEFIGIGPLWFIIMLLIFDFSYVLWRLILKNEVVHPLNGSSSLTYQNISIYILMLTLTSYLIRIILPMDFTLLGFPTLSYLPQYVSFFLIGTAAYRNDWLRKISGSMAIRVFVISLIAAFILFPLALTGHFEGRGSWESGVYALWDSTFAVGMSLALITIFRQYINLQKRYGQFLSQQSYMVYIVHILIIVLIAAIVLQGLYIESFLKFGLATILSVPSCFGAAYLIRKIPFVDKVI